MAATDPLTAPIPGAEHRELAGVQMDTVRAAAARVKRSIYPAGFHWARDIKPHVGTDTCMHAHIGFLARGRIHMEYPDGCALDYVAPSVIAIEPGHDGRVVGNEPAVVIEFDFEGETARRCGMPERHQHKLAPPRVSPEGPIPAIPRSKRLTGRDPSGIARRSPYRRRREKLLRIPTIRPRNASLGTVRQTADTPTPLGSWKQRSYGRISVKSVSKRFVRNASFVKSLFFKGLS